MKPQFSILNSQFSISRGQTLIEVLAALGVGVVVLIAITSAVLTSLSNTQFANNQNQATFYAQQGMEIVRNIKNSGWSSFSGYTGVYCLPKDDTSPNSGVCQTSSDSDFIDGFYKREIRFTRDPLDSNKVQVNVTVSFTDSKGEHKSELISVFTNWQ